MESQEKNEPRGGAAEPDIRAPLKRPGIDKTRSSRIVLVLPKAHFYWSRAHRARMSRGCARADVVAAGCARRSAARLPAPVPAKIGSTETGIASWYGVPYDGRPAASGEIFDMEKLTAAHRALPFETWVEITNLSNGKQVDVRITDRGPFVRGRIIDLSMAAARQIDMVRAGTARVRLKVIDAPVTNPAATAVTPARSSRTCTSGESLSTAPARAGDVCRSGGRFLRSLARRSLARNPALLRCESGRAAWRSTGQTRLSGECWSDMPSPFKQPPPWLPRSKRRPVRRSSCGKTLKNRIVYAARYPPLGVLPYPPHTYPDPLYGGLENVSIRL